MLLCTSVYYSIQKMQIKNICRRTVVDLKVTYLPESNEGFLTPSDSDSDFKRYLPGTCEVAIWSRLNGMAGS